jgi:hypothetical protein
MIVNFDRRLDGSVDDPYVRVHQEHGLSMQLRQGSMEGGITAFFYQACFVSRWRR